MIPKVAATTEGGFWSAVKPDDLGGKLKPLESTTLRNLVMKFAEKGGLQVTKIKLEEMKRRKENSVRISCEVMLVVWHILCMCSWGRRGRRRFILIEPGIQSWRFRRIIQEVLYREYVWRFSRIKEDTSYVLKRHYSFEVLQHRGHDAQKNFRSMVA